MQLTGKTYDALKFLAQVLLPAIGAAYFSLAGIWGLPSADEVVGTIVVVDTFLGVVLQISSSNFQKGVGAGTIVVKQTPGGKTYTLEFDGNPELELDDKDRILFDIRGGPEPTRPDPSE